MKYFCALIFLSILFSCANIKTLQVPPSTPTQPSVVEIEKPNHPKNIILLIGDGMGLSQVSSCYFFDSKTEPNFNRFPVVGLISTTSADAEVTDSAAGATAFAAGIKTYNGAISKNVNKENVETLVERIEGKNIATGLVATSQITHATPACFYAHQESRNSQEAIAEQLVNSSIDYFAGGGIQYFTKREDKKNLLPILKQKGFVVDTIATNFNKTLSLDKKHGYLLAQRGMPSKLDGRGDFLPNATQQAMSYLSQQPNGFFLMVEGSQIDWEGHAASIEGTVLEMQDFDKTLKVALDFAEKDGNTLVVVTADHETGGFSLQPAFDETTERYNYTKVAGGFYEGAKQTPSAAHTATLVPVFAYGPMAEKFGGIYENTEIHSKIIEVTNW